MTVDALLLYPGAGGDCSHHTLVALEEGLEPIRVDRRDFSYRAKRRGPPDRAPKLIAEVDEHADALSNKVGAALVLGGRSMGGRMCSLAVAAGLEAAGLVLLSYPLHPPGKPDRLRVEHFGDLEVPCLFISGTKDPFGTPEELTTAVEAIPGPVRLEWLDDQGHDPKGVDALIVDLVRDWSSGL